MTLNIHGSQHVTDSELNGRISKLSDEIRERRMHFFLGNCYRSETEPVCRLAYWIPKQGVMKPGEPSLTYIDILKGDAGLENEENKIAMQDRKYEVSL